MIVAALIILIVVVLIVLAAILGGSAATSLDLGSFRLDTTAMAVFFLGMITLLLLVMSLAMFRVGMRRSRARRADRRKVGELSRKLDNYHRDDPDYPDRTDHPDRIDRVEDHRGHRSD